MLARDEHVLFPGSAAANADGADDRCCAGQHVSPVNGGGKPDVGSPRGDHLSCQPLSDLKRRGVNVDQGDIGFHIALQQVRDESLSERRAARADKDDLLSHVAAFRSVQLGAAVYRPPSLSMI